MGYIDLKYKPTENDVVCSFYLEPSPGVTLTKAAEDIAAESSIGTWTEVATMSDRIRKLGAKVFSIRNNIVKVAYPEELFEKGNLSQILSSIAGNIFGMKAIKNLRLLDIEFTEGLVRSFQGPEVGLEEVREITGVYNRPLLGTIFKPKLGLTPKEMEVQAHVIYSNGIDWAKDDENLASMKFNKFEERAQRMLGVVDRIYSEEGRRVIYAPNITGPLDKMLERAELVKELGGRCIMVDVLTVGWSALQYIRKQNFGRIVHGHRAMHAALTRNKKHGISMMVIAKCSRLVGVSALHTGTVFGKMEGGKEDVSKLNEFLKSDFYGMKKVMPIASGGLHPGLVPKLYNALGNDLIINFGGGLWGHPQSPAAGARAIRQSLDAALKGISLAKYAESHEELRAALKKWV
ncbi:MAG: type III ribulose-bisphosphate carboxylase [Candidatus Micrarchaeota archaeon]|nr:type III ribulose-bisphosphate carboxylase [Candidatus Micrarchaeota archaeon]